MRYGAAHPNVSPAPSDNLPVSRQREILGEVGGTPGSCCPPPPSDPRPNHLEQLQALRSSERGVLSTAHGTDTERAQRCWEAAQQEGVTLLSEHIIGFGVSVLPTPPKRGEWKLTTEAQRGYVTRSGSQTPGV